MPMVRAQAIGSRESKSLDNRRVPFRERVPRGVISRAGLELVTPPAERHSVCGNVRSALPEFNDVVDLEEFSGATDDALIAIPYEDARAKGISSLRPNRGLALSCILIPEVELFSGDEPESVGVPCDTSGCLQPLTIADAMFVDVSGYDLEARSLTKHSLNRFQFLRCWPESGLWVLERIAAGGPPAREGEGLHPEQVCSFLVALRCLICLSTSVLRLPCRAHSVSDKGTRAKKSVVRTLQPGLGDVLSAQGRAHMEKPGIPPASPFCPLGPPRTPGRKATITLRIDRLRDHCEEVCLVVRCQARAGN